MKCWVFSRDCSIGLGWGIPDLLREKLAPVDGDKSGSWYIPSDSMWSGSIQEVSREIKGNFKDFKKWGKLIILLIIIPALWLLRFLTNGTSFCTKGTHLEYGTNLPWMLRNDCINCTPKSVLNSFNYGICIISLH